MQINCNHWPTVGWSSSVICGLCRISNVWEWSTVVKNCNHCKTNCNGCNLFETVANYQIFRCTLSYVTFGCVWKPLVSLDGIEAQISIFMKFKFAWWFWLMWGSPGSRELPMTGILECKTYYTQDFIFKSSRPLWCIWPPHLTHPTAGVSSCKRKQTFLCLQNILTPHMPFLEQLFHTFTKPQFRGDVNRLDLTIRAGQF